MKSRQFVYCLIILLSFSTCKDKDPNSHIDEGLVKEDTYYSKEIGWSIELPKDWDVVESDMQNKFQKKGLEAIQEANNIEVDMSGLKNLISFKKDQHNLFLSTSEPYELAYEGEWEENHENVKNFIINTYTSNGIDHDVTSTSIETIDGLEFKTFTFTLYDPNGKVLLKQAMYGRHINGYDFSTCINYNNDDDRDVMLKAFRNSKFRKGKG